jgi:hypothetical protein
VKAKLLVNFLSQPEKSEFAAGDINLQRSVLPTPDKPYRGLIVYDAKNVDAKFPPIQPIRPPKKLQTLF